jgi:hypothetical protein
MKFTAIKLNIHITMLLHTIEAKYNYKVFSGCQEDFGNLPIVAQVIFFIPSAWTTIDPDVFH